MLIKQLSPVSTRRFRWPSEFRLQIVPRRKLRLRVMPLLLRKIIMLRFTTVVIVRFRPPTVLQLWRVMVLFIMPGSTCFMVPAMRVVLCRLTISGPRLLRVW